MTTMLDREVRDLANVQGRSELPRLLRLAATRAMGLLNCASQARDSEAFVASELAKQVTWSRVRPGVYHYRTHTQQEVDLVLEDAAGRLVGIEVKKTASPSSTDFKGLRHLRERTGRRFLRRILLHTGAAAVTVEPGLRAAPVSTLWHLAAGGENMTEANLVELPVQRWQSCHVWRAIGKANSPVPGGPWGVPLPGIRSSSIPAFQYSMRSW